MGSSNSNSTSSSSGRKKGSSSSSSAGDVEDVVSSSFSSLYGNEFKKSVRPASQSAKSSSGSSKGEGSEDDDGNKVMFPELEQTGIDEKALRSSPIGKVLFGVLDLLFPVFKVRDKINFTCIDNNAHSLISCTCIDKMYMH